MSRQITITNGEDEVSLMCDLEFTVKTQRLGGEYVTMGGKTVLDVFGYRKSLIIPTGWLSNLNLALLTQMISKCPKLTVTYPDVDGDKTEDFIFEMPIKKAFRYDGSGVERWYGVTLEAVGGEVS